MSHPHARTEILIGAAGLARLQAARVLVAGLGGVGGHAAEALGRAGIGRLTLLDHDVVSLSNLNRQLLALHSTLGQYKVDAMAARIADIDPTGKRKTLIFCVNTDHADLVVDVLKAAFEAQYGSVEDDAVIKITGNADKPLELIRRFKNERLPNVAVTVDLLTTGVDVRQSTQSPRESGVVRLKR